jgi:hypothetical protein
MTLQGRHLQAQVQAEKASAEVMYFLTILIGLKVEAVAAVESEKLKQ